MMTSSINRPTRMLIWKEWRELRIPLGMLLAYVSTWTVLCLYVNGVIGNHLILFDFLQISSISYLVSILLSMRLGYWHDSDNDTSFILALPLSRRRIGMIRLACSIVVLLAPLIVSGLIFLSFQGIRAGIIESGIFDWGRYFDSMTGIALTLIKELHSFLIMAIVCSYCRNATTAGLSGLAVHAILSCFAYPLNRSPFDSSLAYRVLFPASQFQLTGIPTPDRSEISWEFRSSGNLTGFFLLEILFLLSLGYFFLQRYGRKDPTQISSMTDTLLDFTAWLIKSPNRFLTTTRRSLVWSTLRQSSFLAITLLLIHLLYESTTRTSMYSSSPLYLNVLVRLGPTWTLLVGIVLFAEDLTDSRDRFWRSLPVERSTWFWTKYLTGLIFFMSFLLAFEFVSILLYGAFYNLHPSSIYSPDLMMGLALRVTSYWSLYSLGILGVFLFRKALYAGIFGMMIPLMINLFVMLFRHSIPSDRSYLLILQLSQMVPTVILGVFAMILSRQLAVLPPIRWSVNLCVAEDSSR